MARKIEVQIVGDASSLERAFGRASGASRTFGSRLAGVAKGAAVAGGAAALGGLAVTLQRGWREFSEAAKVTAQTGAVLKSTGAAAGVTAGHVENLAGKLSRMSGVDDEAIQSGENLLLTFTKIKNSKHDKIFDLTTQAVLDMSVAMGTDMRSAALQVGKAMQDPVAGGLALRRAGIDATAIKAAQELAKMGDTVGAQKLLLKELNKEFGGSAKAAGDTLPGKLATLRNAFDEVAGRLVEKLVPYLTRFADWATAHMPQIEAAFGKAFKVIGSAISDVAPVIRTFVGVIRGLMPVLGPIAGLIMDVIFTPLKTIAALIRGDWSGAWDALKAPVMRVIDLLKGIWELVGPALTQLGDWFVGLPGRIAGTLGNLASQALEPFKNAFTSAKDWVGEKVADMVTFFTELPGKLWAVLKGELTGAMNFYKGLFTSAKDWVGEKLNDMAAFFAALPGKLWTIVRGELHLMFLFYKGLFTTAKDWVMEKLNDTVGFFRSLPGRIAGTFGELASIALGPFKSAFTAARDWVRDMIDDVVGFFRGLPGKIRAFVGEVGKAAQAFADKITGAFGGVLSFLQGVYDKIMAIKNALAGAFSIGDSSNTGVPAIDGRAKGGPVRRGASYVVGERGPELFVPRASGTVIANGRGAGGGGGGWPEVIQLVLDSHVLTQVVRKEMNRTAKQNARPATA